MLKHLLASQNFGYSEYPWTRYLKFYPDSLRLRGIGKLMIFDLMIHSLHEFSFIIWKSASEDLSYLSLGIVVLLLDAGYSHL
jgi:hypothetical protein